jgi:CBS domain-containing protein
MSMGIGAGSDVNVQSGGRMPGATRLGPATLSPITIEDIARTEVVTAEPDDTIESIIDDMAENDVGSVVVVEDDRPVGILTDRNVALALRDTSDLLEMTAEDIMAEDLATASVDSDAFEVLDRMSEAGVRRIPLVGDDGELRGIVTLDDVLLYLEDNLNTVAETIRAQFPDL